MAMGIRHWLSSMDGDVKGVLIVLLFTGALEFRPFEYQPKDYDGSPGYTPEEIGISCSERAEELYEIVATHSWDDPRGHGYYLNDGTGKLVGHHC